jgi:hypothetical protein
MSEIALGTLFAAALFIGMVILLELGRRLRRHHRMRHGDSAGEGAGAIEAAVFGLMGLLLAFTFSGAATRFDARRQLVVDEARAIPDSMFDLSTTRLASTRIHPPPIIYGLLGVVSLLCALLAGYGMGASESRSWLHMLGLAAVLAITIYVIVDLEYPRLGFFQISDFDQLLVEVRASMR